MELYVEMTQDEFKKFITSYRKRLARVIEGRLTTYASVGAKALLQKNIKAKDLTKDSRIYAPYYAIYVEYGTGPRGENSGDEGAPSGESKNFIPNLRLWVKKKWAPPKNKLDGATYVLARHIKKHGTKPQRFIRNYLEYQFPSDATNLMYGMLEEYKALNYQMDTDLKRMDVDKQPASM